MLKITRQIDTGYRDKSDFFVKNGISKLFNYNEEQNYITYLKIIYMNNISLWVLPFLLIHSYTTFSKDFFKWTSIAIFLILLILRYIFIISRYKKLIRTRLFYFILYICTLEIAPLLLFVKWIAKMKN